MSKITNSLIAPKLREHKSYREFFKAFWDLNQELSFFSSRYLAAKLGWSSSYFHDVLADRKKLTIPKAIEIAHFMELSQDDIEHLVWMVISEIDHPLSKDFALKKLVGVCS